jgi:hypothetical protein
VFNKSVQDTFGEGVRGTNKVERSVHGTRKVEKHCLAYSEFRIARYGEVFRSEVPEVL